MKSASLFTGFGGADIGAQMAGYEIAWGIELDDAIAQVARYNGLPAITADVLDCNLKDFEAVSHLHASPPCPSFSVAKAGAAETAHDIALADKTAEFITVLKPRTVTIENVPGPIIDPPTDDIDDALAEIYGRPDSRLPVLRLAALLLGLCAVTGAAAFVAATGGGVGWAVGVFVVLMAVFGLGVMAGR